GERLAAVVAETGARVRFAPQGGPLRLYRRVFTSTRVALSCQESEFLLASIRQDRRRRARTVSILSGLLVVALVGAALALFGQQTADRQRARATGQQAEAARQHTTAL